MYLIASIDGKKEREPFSSPPPVFSLVYRARRFGLIVLSILAGVCRKILSHQSFPAGRSNLYHHSPCVPAWIGTQLLSRLAASCFASMGGLLLGTQNRHGQQCATHTSLNDISCGRGLSLSLSIRTAWQSDLDLFEQERPEGNTRAFGCSCLDTWRYSRTLPHRKNQQGKPSVFRLVRSLPSPLGFRCFLFGFPLTAFAKQSSGFSFARAPFFMAAFKKIVCALAYQLGRCANNIFHKWLVLVHCFISFLNMLSILLYTSLYRKQAGKGYTLESVTL